MSNEQKAKLFIEYKANGDNRCDLLLMFLSTAMGISVSECMASIEDMASNA